MKTSEATRRIDAEGTRALVMSKMIGSLVWVLTEEVELGSENGETHWVIGVHLTEEGANDAREAWLKSHGGDMDEHPFAGDAEAYWCEECRRGVAIATMKVAA